MAVLIVGVLNVTPDSFSDGGRFSVGGGRFSVDAGGGLSPIEAAVAEGVRLVEQGADWIDVGGESTRPGAAVVPEEEERARVVPVIAGLAARLGGRARISIDTYKAGTAGAALAAGATVVNDVSGGLLDPPILGVAARARAAVILGHLRGAPATMMQGIAFGDVVEDVGRELAERIAEARAVGCAEVWADPGIGFGKLAPHNLTLVARLSELRARLGVPLMVGVSRKRFIGDLTGRPVGERLWGTAGAVAAAVLGGAEAVRVHDVAEMRDVVRVAEAIAAARRGD